MSRIQIFNEYIEVKYSERAKIKIDKTSLKITLKSFYYFTLFNYLFFYSIH